MTRQSKFAYLKPHIEKFYAQGKTPYEVMKLFPEVPDRTLRDWHKAMRERGLIPEKEEPQTVDLDKPVSAESIDEFLADRPVLTLVHSTEDDSLSDIEWAKTQLKMLYKTSYSEGLKLQAVNVFIKACQIESALKQSPKEVEREPIDTSQYENMNETELQQLYKEMLG